VPALVPVYGWSLHGSWCEHVHKLQFQEEQFRKHQRQGTGTERSTCSQELQRGEHVDRGCSPGQDRNAGERLQASARLLACLQVQSTVQYTCFLHIRSAPRRPHML